MVEHWTDGNLFDDQTPTFATPPRHLHKNDQDEKVTHWLSGSVAWDAVDPDAG